MTERVLLPAGPASDLGAQTALALLAAGMLAWERVGLRQVPGDETR